MSLHRQAIAATQVLLLSAAIGSCGGSESSEDPEGLSADALAAQADEVCSRSADDLTDSLTAAARLKTRALKKGKLEDQNTRIEIADADTEVATVITLAASDLDQLKPSADLRPEFDAYINSLYSTSEFLNRAALAVEVIAPAFDARTLANYQKAASAFTRAQELAKGLGFRGCSSWAEFPGPPPGQPEGTQAS
jgi:hypothetical protein